MAEIQIRITNLAQIKAAFKMAPRLMTANLNRAIRMTVIKVSGDAARNAPADTSNLRASIIRDIRFSNLRGEIAPKTKYAVYVHEGTGIYHPQGRKTGWVYKDRKGNFRFTRGMKPRPFLKDAVKSNQHTIDRHFTEAVQNVLDTIGKRI